MENGENPRKWLYFTVNYCQIKKKKNTFEVTKFNGEDFRNSLTDVSTFQAWDGWPLWPLNVNLLSRIKNSYCCGPGSRARFVFFFFCVYRNFLKLFFKQYIFLPTKKRTNLNCWLVNQKERHLNLKDRSNLWEKLVVGHQFWKTKELVTLFSGIS